MSSKLEIPQIGVCLGRAHGHRIVMGISVLTAALVDSDFLWPIAILLIYYNGKVTTQIDLSTDFFTLRCKVAGNRRSCDTGECINVNFSIVAKGKDIMTTTRHHRGISARKPVVGNLQSIRPQYLIGARGAKGSTIGTL